MCVVTQVPSNEIKQTRLLTDVTISRDRIFRFDARRVEDRAQRIGALELVVRIFDECREWNALRARDVTGARHLAGVLRKEACNACDFV